MALVLATKSPGEREDNEAERLMRQAPKKKPPRHDRRREEMRADSDKDTDDDPDLKGKDRSLNYKTIGGSLVEHVVERYATEHRSIRKDRRSVIVRSRETGKVVFVSPKTLRENPDKYEKYEREQDKAPSPSGEPGAQPGTDKPKPPRPRPKPKQEAQPAEQAPAPEKEAPEKPEPAIAGDTPAEPEPKEAPASGEEPEERGDDAEDSEDVEDDDSQSEDGDDGEEAEPEPEPPVAEKLGIPPPTRREATVAEHEEAALMLADHLPHELAAKLIASNIHPDDAKQLIGSYRAAKSRSVGNPAEFAEKTAQFYQTDPDRVPPPQSWRNADGKKVAFDELSPEEKANAYRQHQMQVVATSLAAEHQLEEKLSHDGTVTPLVSKLLTKSLLGKLPEEHVTKLAEQIFEKTAGAKGFAKIPDGQVEKMLSSVEGNDGARALLQSYLEANDYKRAKALYLNKKFSERDKPQQIVDGLRAARDFFKVQARAYGKGDEGHEGARRFETRTLAQLRELNPKKYATVRREIDHDYAKDYRHAQRQYERELKAFKSAHEAWKKDPFSGLEPKPPTQPIEPIGYSNAKNSHELADEGRQLWKDLQERSGTTKTAAVVASKFLISSYLSGNPMHRTSAPRAKRALYHGISPGANYPREPYPKWGPVQTRDIAEPDHSAILVAAKAWLKAPISTLGVDGMVPDQKFRQALDLALSAGTYKPDVQTYNVLLAKLQGVTEPGLEQSGLLTKKADAERSRLERAIYAKFPPDSKRKQGGRQTVLLTGDTAAKLKRPAYSPVALSELSDSEITVLARTMHVASSSIGDPSSNRNSDNGESQMLRLSNEQKTTANQILSNFDQLAQSIQENYRKWGMSAEAAKGVVNHLDRTADAAESLFFGENSLRTRQAEVALASEDFVSDAIGNGMLTRAHVNKAARVIQRDSDEAYMDTFKNPMAPIETDSDEPYMTAYGDDQSSSVVEGEDDTGRDLAPEA